MNKKASDVSIDSCMTIYREPQPRSKFQQIQTKQNVWLKTSPSCLDILFMLPVPFLGIGCCISRSVSLLFNPNTEYITYTACYGLLCCWNTKRQIHYDKVKGTKIERDADTHRCNERTFVVYLITKTQQLPITGSLLQHEAQQIDKQLNQFLIEHEIIDKPKNYR